jgi:hypothetical protein
MVLTDNEKRIIDVLIANPTINNQQLARKTYMANRTLNATFISLYSKYHIDGRGRAKRGKLIEILNLNRSEK